MATDVYATICALLFVCYCLYLGIPTWQIGWGKQPENRKSVYNLLKLFIKYFVFWNKRCNSENLQLLQNHTFTFWEMI